MLINKIPYLDLYKIAQNYLGEKWVEIEIKKELDIISLIATSGYNTCGSFKMLYFGYVCNFSV